MVQGLIDSLLNAKIDDLREIEVLIRDRTKELDSLNALRDVLVRRLGKPVETTENVQFEKIGPFVSIDKPSDIPKGSPQPQRGEMVDVESFAQRKSEPQKDTELVRQRKEDMVKCIQANGPLSLDKLSLYCKIPSGSIGAIIKDPRFVKTAIGYGLRENHK